MCLLFVAYHEHPDFPLVIAANRDEFFARPTRAARFWETHPDLLGGRDLEQGGTWLGVTRSGRWAALTNYREPGKRGGGESRGLLVLRVLTQTQDLPTALQEIAAQQGDFDGFNLLAGDGDSLWYFSNRATEPRALSTGIYALSNHLLDSPWPKVVNGRDRLAKVLAEGVHTDRLFCLLRDQNVAPDSDLPDTGVGLEAERWLSPAFISNPQAGYGTRCSTVLTIDHRNRVVFEERSFFTDERSCHGPDTYQAVHYEFTIRR